MYQRLDNESDSDDGEPAVLPLGAPVVALPDAPLLEGSLGSQNVPSALVSRNQSGFLRAGKLAPNTLQLTVGRSVAEGASTSSGQPLTVPAHSQALSSVVRSRPQPYNILLLGAPQSGKSSLVNAYRLTLLGNEKWVQAPVGKCGLVGTSAVDGYYNHPANPSWCLIDTPGKVYCGLDGDDSPDAVLLGCLFAGVSWPTRTVGRQAVSPSQMAEQETQPTHRAHQCIIVVSACDLVVDGGLSNSWLSWMPRYRSSPQADQTVANLQQLVQHVVDSLGEPPFVLVTHMDCIGGVSSTRARTAVMSHLQECAPVNCIFFASLPPDVGARRNQLRSLTLVDVATRQEILRLHQEIASKVCWSLLRDPLALQHYLRTMGRR